MRKTLKYLGCDKQSLNRIRRPSNLAVIGMFIAVYVICQRFAVTPVPWMRINFGFIALMSVGMLFGSAAAVIAAIPCDILGAMADPSSTGINLAFTPVAALSGLICGIFLYERGLGENQKKFGIMINLCRISDILICQVFLNTWLLYKFEYISHSDGIVYQIGVRGFKNAAEFVLSVLIAPIVLIPVRIYYKKFFGADAVNDNILSENS